MNKKFLNYGDFIRKLRMKNKLTQEELASGICDQTTISRLESGK